MDEKGHKESRASVREVYLRLIIKTYIFTKKKKKKK